MQVKNKVDPLILFRLWSDKRLTKPEIAKQLGTTERKLDTLAARYKLPERQTRHRAFSIVDPTPEEIAERALECRLKHLAAKRSERIVPQIEVYK